MVASSASHALTDRHAVVVHYNEIGLKGRNRGQFEGALVRNLERALAGRGQVEVMSGRMLVHLPGPPDPAVTDALRRTFGVAVFAPAVEVEADLETLCRTALRLLVGQPAETFAVAARRSTKELPFTSTDINVAVGDAVRTSLGMKVDLGDPEVTVHIEIVGKRAWVYVDRVPGPGGLPVGVSGRVMSLLSGGIDSPVATWKVLKRGTKASLVHFHSAPFTDRASTRKAIELAEAISSWQGTTRLYMVAFGEAQQRIVVGAPPPLRVVLYRRFMVRVAAALARRERARFLVTGDSLGQVASQTLDNLLCVEDAAPMPILRPLVGDDKQDIIDLAKTIGTYETSILPYQDCCSLFVPRSPATHASVEECRQAERDLPVDEIVAACVAGAELHVPGREPAT
jgi:tRNA uracil 4-sulfurtransferase